MKRQAEQFDTDRRDRETIAAVRHRIEHSRHKGLRRVKAKISDGTITLFGTVPTEDDLELAITMVGDVSHVERVIDEIEVIVPDARTS